MSRKRLLSPDKVKHLAIVYLAGAIVHHNDPKVYKITQWQLCRAYNVSQSTISESVRRGAEMILSEAGIIPGDDRAHIIDQAVKNDLSPELALAMSRYVLWRRYGEGGTNNAPWLRESFKVSQIKQTVRKEGGTTYASSKCR